MGQCPMLVSIRKTKVTKNVDHLGDTPWYRWTQPVFFFETNGLGFTWITTDNTTIYSRYCSGNDDIQDLEATMEQIGNRIKANKQNSIIASDFNAKSPAWGMRTTDGRGQVIVEWLAANDMTIVNHGTAPTFQRREQTSIIDLTTATNNIKAKITDWHVRMNETLSDHNYIIFNVSKRRGITKQHGENNG